MSREYLNAKQLAELTPWTVDAIEKMVRRGVLKRGVHYFQPSGRRGWLLFKWAAIVDLIEAGARPRPSGPIEAKLGRKRNTLDVEKAEEQLRQLLN